MQSLHRVGKSPPSDGTGGITVGDLQAQKGRFLRLTGPKAGGFLSLTGLWPEGDGGGFAADYKKRARLAPQVV